jgi:hypothetical protein
MTGYSKLFVVALGASSWAASVSAAELLSGTLVRLGPQGLVVKTSTGEVNVALARTNRVNVRAAGSIDALADGTPCLMRQGTIQKGGTEITGAWLVVAGPQAGPFDDHVMLQADGRVNFQYTPGVVRKGPPLVFQIGPRAEVLTLDDAGRLDPASRQQVAQVVNRTVPIAGGGQVAVIFDFGNDLRMAGANAKVEITGTAGSPQTATINIERVEPLPTKK